MPAAGRARRLGEVPCSKEILPVAGPAPPPAGTRVACHWLLGLMARAGVERCYAVIDARKTDIVEFVGDGAVCGVDIAYLVTRGSPDAPTSIDRARNHVRDAIVALGFPDIALEPDDALDRVVRRRARTGADVVLGLLPANDPALVDMVEADAVGRVTAIVPKPQHTTLEWTWLLAAWGPAFTAFLHEHVVSRPPSAREVFIGDVVREAVDAGLRVEAELIPDGRYRDIGTPANLAAAMRGGLGS